MNESAGNVQENEQYFKRFATNVKLLNIVRPLLSMVPGRTKFWSQKPWIIYNIGLSLTV